MKLNLSLAQVRSNRNELGYLSLVTMVTIGSSAPIMIRLAQNQGIPSPLIATLRLLVAFIVLTPIVINQYAPQLKKLERRDVAFTVFTGLWLAFHFMGYIGALSYTTVLITGVISSTSPLVVALLEMIVFKDTPPRIVWLGLTLAIIGGFTIALGGNTDNFGVNPALGAVFALGGAMAFAVYLLGGRPVQGKISLIPYVWMIYGWAGCFALMVTLLSGETLVGHASGGYFWAIMIALFPQILGHSAINLATRIFSPTYVSIIIQLTVVFSSILAIVLFDEIPQPLQLIGGGIILAGATLASIGRGQKKRDKS